jgi:hypothetical protein
MRQCECCENGIWFSECCNGADGCDCRGERVYMSACHVCRGTGMREDNANLRANADSIRGMLFTGSGPTRGYWAGKLRGDIDDE